MAQTAADYLNDNPDSIICVLAGVGHVKGRKGIPDRLMKRMKNIPSIPAPFVIVPEQVSRPI